MTGAGTDHVRILGRLLLVTAFLAATGWGALALHYSGDPSPARDVVMVAYVLASAALFWLGRRRRWARLGGLALFALVLAWFLSLAPRNDRAWQPDVAVLPGVDVAGDTIVVHGVRDNVYRSEQDYTVRHEDRTYSLAGLRTVDLFLSYWGSPWIAHTIVSFGFDDGRYLAVSIETRKEPGEEYSAVAGFFRRYELIYVVADERDVVRLRTNYRGEDVYLYRARTPPPTARALLLDYVERINGLRDRPEWYNALAHNCTTAIPRHSGARSWRNWKLLANGYLDQLAYEIGAVDTTLPFPELRARSRVNARALAAGDAPDFSRRIREGLPSMGPPG
jgi:hypothetical protein